jgi:hypothetical protein
MPQIHNGYHNAERKCRHSTNGVFDDIGINGLLEPQTLQLKSNSFLQVSMPKSDFKQPTSKCNGYRMRPIIGAQFVHEVLDVEIDGCFRYSQLIRNLFVAIPITDESEHLQLPGRKILLAEVFGEAGCHVWWNVPFAGMDRPDHTQQFIFWHALEYISRRTCSQRPLNVAIAI